MTEANNCVLLAGFDAPGAFKSKADFICTRLDDEAVVFTAVDEAAVSGLPLIARGSFSKTYTSILGKVVPKHP